MDNNDFANRFKEAVKYAGVKDTQDALARLFEVSPVTIWAYRNGTKLPHMRTAKRIAQKLGVSTEWLVDGTGRGPNDPGLSEAGEREKYYSYDSLEGLPVSAWELVQLIVNETKAGNLGEEHIELLKNNIKLMADKS